MNKNPFLSIIIPVYNVESYLHQCFNTILNCEFSSYEVVLVIGESDDQSNNICYQYQELYSNFKIVIQLGKGLSNARNCGFQEAKGVYIMYVDSDDFIDSKAFDKTISLLYEMKYPSYDVLVSDFFLVNSEGSVYSQRTQIHNSQLIIEDYHYLKKFLLNKGNYWNVWRYIYRKDFILENNLTFKENYKSEDIDFSTKVLLKAETCCFYHNPYYCYRVGRPGSLVNVITIQNVDNLLTILNDSVYEISNNTEFPYAKIMINKLLLEYIFSFLLIHDIEKKYKEITFEKIFNKRNLLKETLLGKIIYIIVSAAGIPLISIFLLYMRKIRRLALTVFRSQK